MLSPEQIEAAGDAVAAIYNDIEAKMLDHLVDALINIEDLDQQTTTELVLLAQTHTQQLREYIDAESENITDEVRETTEKYLEASDADDIARIGEAAPIWPQQVDATVAGVALILSRDNLKMVEGAKRAFLNASIEAITRVNTGTMTTEKALHAAVRKLEREGIPIITYQNAKTGVVTVANKVDVAVRRHIRTQIAQDGARMTMERLERGEIELVEVSSHSGSRPEHAKWQGRVYSLHGDVTIEGTRYRDFYKATKYGSVDGLLGANCRHSFGPYIHGAPRSYEPNPKHPSGLSNDKVYELTQEQRYMERRIREAKREVRGAQQLLDKNDTLENRTNLIKAQKTLKDRQEGIRNLIKENPKVLQRSPRREWAGDMPKITKVKVSGRKLDDFLAGKSVQAQLGAKGVSTSKASSALKAELKARGLKPSDFGTLKASEQQGLFRNILDRLPSNKKGN